MTDLPVYSISNSEIQTFKDCRRKWYLSYVRRLKSKAVDYTGPLALGSRVHRALELYYTTGEDLLDVWRQLVADDRDIMTMADRDLTDFDNEADLGRIMLEGYIDWVASEGFDSDVVIISNEEVLTTPMLGGRVELKAKIDQRVKRKSDGARIVRDFKSTAGFANLTRTAHLNEQLLTYMLIEMLQRAEADRCDGGQFVMLRKVKRTASARPPFYDVAEIRHNVFEMRNFWTRINAELRDMVDARDALAAGADHHAVAYPRPSNDCTWKCQFFSVCQMFDDGSAVEQAVHDQYDEADPYGYYEPDYKFGE